MGFRSLNILLLTGNSEVHQRPNEITLFLKILIKYQNVDRFHRSQFIKSLYMDELLFSINFK